jgi:hypothetical protein
MSKRWINTKVEFEWSEELQQYVEISSDGYWYEGDMALCFIPGAIGGAGGPGVTSEATTRLHVIDPHLVIMMRDVMDDAATAARLTVCSGASGGGGGGGGEGGFKNGGDGGVGGEGTAASNCILPHSGSKGGNGGAGSSVGPDYAGGNGGGGGGGNGGVFVLITTTTGANTGSIILNGGKGGAGDTSGQGANGRDGQPGSSGSFMHIRV